MLHCQFLFLVYCFFVIGLVGLCCKPQLLIIIIIIISFYPRDAVSGVLATATRLAGWLGVRHTPVLYQNG